MSASTLTEYMYKPSYCTSFWNVSPLFFIFSDAETHSSGEEVKTAVTAAPVRLWICRNREHKFKVLFISRCGTYKVNPTKNKKTQVKMRTPGEIFTSFSPSVNQKELKYNNMVSLIKLAEKQNSSKRIKHFQFCIVARETYHQKRD